jgi:hypothetical protein
MDSAIWIALILAGAIIALAMMFYKPISRRIDGGASFEASIAPGGAKLLLTSSDKAPANPKGQPLDESQPAKASRLLPDVRLLHLIPTLSPFRFQTIELPRRQPLNFYAWSSAPVGVYVIDHVPFFLQPVGDATGKWLGHHAVDVHPTEDNTQSDVEVPANVQDVTTVHLLLSAGNGWVSQDNVQYMGRRIGCIVLIFADKSEQIVNLVLGQNIREWAFGNSTNLVREIEYGQTKPAWVSYDNTHRIDIMSIPVEKGPKDLKTLRIVARFESEHLEKPLPLPAIIVSAITCERKA